MPRIYDDCVIFDADCVLCSAWVRFILRHERNHDLRFINSWSNTGLALAAQFGLSRDDLQRTFLVISEDVGLTYSDAGIALLGRLKAPWRWLRIVAIAPRKWRDALYKLVARNRYQWFGRKERCFVPSPDMRSRFIDR
jgi:predicted DCC family thiol-disulfide oxidoreductase YuxK